MEGRKWTVKNGIHNTISWYNIHQKGDIMTERDMLIYMAGFFDGEGCVGLNRSRSATVKFEYRVEVQINQVDKEPLMLFKNRYGGTLIQDMRSKKNKNWQDVWHWLIADKSAKRCLEDLKPFCIVRKYKILLALEYLGLRRLDNSSNIIRSSQEQRERALKTNEQIINQRREIYAKFRKLCIRNTAKQDLVAV
jgi:hypothetical protein